MAEFRFTDEQWREYQAIPDQGYSHRGWIEHQVNAWLKQEGAFSRGWHAGLAVPVDPERFAAVWDECLDAIEQNELNTEQAREGNPYRRTSPDSPIGADD